MRKFWILISVLAAISSQCWADDVKTSPSLVSVDATKVEIRTVLKDIEKQANVTILADSSITGPVTATLDKISVDQALQLICRTKNVQVQKAYVAAKQLDSSSADRIIKALTALRTLEELGYGITTTDKDGKIAALFAKNQPIDSVQSTIMKKEAGYKLVYLITPAKSGDATAQNTPTPSKAVESQKEWLSDLSQLSPDQQRQALQQGFRDLFGNQTQGISNSAVVDSFKQVIRTMPNMRRLLEIGIRPAPMADPTMRPRNPANVNPGYGGNPGNNGGNNGGNDGGNGGGDTPPTPDDAPPPPPV